MTALHHMTYVFEHEPPCDGYALSDSLEEALNSIERVDEVIHINDDYREEPPGDAVRVLTFRIHYSREGLVHGLLGVEFFDGLLPGQWRCVGEFDH